MKKVMVFDVAAESGGALTILNQYYEKAKEEKNVEWIFILSVAKLANQDNIKVIRYPWIKKSWFHRLYFDRSVAYKLVEQYQPDELLSLQNLIIPKVDIEQTVYLHQALPFVNKQYKITENIKFWIYQNIIGRMIYQSIKDADNIIVQTKWIKDAAIKKTGAPGNKFVVKTPKISIDVKEYYHIDRNKNNLFFYPAGPGEYKNHKVIVDAAKLLKNKNISNYKVLFTLSGDESKHISELYKDIKGEGLPIRFIGPIPIEKVYEYYSNSILIFPSYIETFGLPLLEARLHKTPVIASKLPFSSEVLENYEKYSLFNPYDAEELADLINKHISN